MKSYTYDPSKITENGKDRMRFELGDTVVEGMEETCALTDEEYKAALAMYPRKWRKAKLALLSSIVHRFMYEVDTKVGPLSLSLHQRAEAWKAMRPPSPKTKRRSGATRRRGSVSTCWAR